MVMQPKHLVGNFVVAENTQIAVLSSTFNSFIVEQLEKGALDTLFRYGMTSEQITRVTVPGAYELPLVAQKLVRTKQYDGIIALGAVIRGATPHFEYVSSAAANGLAKVSLESDIPIGFGVLTTDTIEQAIERAGTKAGNKGSECALSIIEMISLCRQLESERVERR